MSIIDSDYFKQDINLPTSNANTDIDNVITLYEPRILEEVLGYELGQLVNDYVAVSSPQPILDLVEGKEYTIDYNGRTQTLKWNGLKNEIKVSLIAYYVYVMWQRNHASNTTNVGETASEVELSNRVSPAQKMGSAWYKMRELLGYSGQGITKPSMYNFLKENESDYPELIFSDVGRMNMFGI